MAIESETKDCTALSDAELADMADLCADGPTGIDIGMLSKEREEWVLVTLVSVNGKLHGFMFSTLERIGGTPSVVMGPASVKRTNRRNSVLRALLDAQFHKALMAFPDEDVLIGTRMADASGFEGFAQLDDIVPRPGHKATGEERAWGRRLAKRFKVDKSYDDRAFVSTGDGSPTGVLDHESTAPDRFDPAVVTLFDGTDPARGDCLIAFGWAMAEYLSAHG